MKIAIILHGPLKSIGKSGKDAHTPKDQLSDNTSTIYNCLEGKNNLTLSVGSHHNIYYVHRENDSIDLENVTTIKIEAQNKARSWKRNNSDLLRENLLCALNAIEGYDYYLFLRTDQLVPLDMLINCLSEDNLLFSNVGRKRIYFQDFVIGIPEGKKEQFISALGVESGFSSNIHIDIPIRLMSCYYNKQYPPYVRTHYKINDRLYNDYYDYISENVDCLEIEMFSNIVWRGSKLSDEFVEYEVNVRSQDKINKKAGCKFFSFSCFDYQLIIGRKLGFVFNKLCGKVFKVVTGDSW
ncbi:hypothetical protein [Vibrio paucivorans]|uniref:Uncharacterized protein n=1 Tax=Vibrio paucivorans TaxID=2829489 RepID=A0A9X3CDC4_9VIBR|nr:hypothetical protein [Vibrio paucivorans]MCW8333618.1 hypothetical protein [Vibrio paucivorans]